MRFFAFPVLVCLALTATSCWSGPEKTESPFLEPNKLMAREIDERIAQVPFQQREELFNNLLWLAQTGEQAIPSLLTALRHENPKVRSNILWVLGRIRDRRTIPQMQTLVRDSDEAVRLEAARSLVLMGDMQHVPILVEGLDSTRNEVRYYCHQTLKHATGRNFGYDHLEEDLAARQQATYRWRKWWADQSGDPWFAKDYASERNLDVFEAENQWLNGSAPMPVPGGEGESAPMPSDDTGSEDEGQMIIEIVDPNGSSGSAGGAGSTTTNSGSTDGDDESSSNGWVDPAGGNSADPNPSGSSVQTVETPGR